MELLQMLQHRPEELLGHLPVGVGEGVLARRGGPRIADKGPECNPSASQTPVSPKEWVSWA